MKDIAKLRNDYRRDRLDESAVLRDPYAQFKQWMEDALGNKLHEPTAVTLATASLRGVPSLRTVLLKGVDERGFQFYSNYESRKGRELAVNPSAALLFFWPELERQIRINGRVTRLPRAESEEYFRSRPLESQLGAWASAQSSTIENRQVLEDRFQRLREKYADGNVPLPDFWGGYSLLPDEIEFWQGGGARLHDRIVYQASESGWSISRLAP